MYFLILQNKKKICIILYSKFPKEIGRKNLPQNCKEDQKIFEGKGALFLSLFCIIQLNKLIFRWKVDFILVIAFKLRFIMSIFEQQQQQWVNKNSIEDDYDAVDHMKYLEEKKEAAPTQHQQKMMMKKKKRVDDNKGFCWIGPIQFLLLLKASPLFLSLNVLLLGERNSPYASGLSFPPPSAQSKLKFKEKI